MFILLQGKVRLAQEQALRIGQMFSRLQRICTGRVTVGFAGILRRASRGAARCLSPSEKVGLKSLPLTGCGSIFTGRGVKACQQNMLGWSFWSALHSRHR